MTYYNHKPLTDQAFGPESGQQYSYVGRDGHTKYAHHPKFIEHPPKDKPHYWVSEREDDIIIMVDYHLKEMLVEAPLTDKELKSCRQYADQWEKHHSICDVEYIPEDGMFQTFKHHHCFTGLAEYVASQIVADRGNSTKYNNLNGFWSYPKDMDQSVEWVDNYSDYLDPLADNYEPPYVAAQLSVAGFNVVTD